MADEEDLEDVNFSLSERSFLKERQAEFTDSNRDALVFAIECTAEMVATRTKQDGTQGDSTLVTTLKNAFELMKRKVIISRKDLIGIVLFNTASSFPFSCER